jgi:GDP-L-fucose synthase
MKKDAKIFVAGHNGLVGSAIVRRLHQAGYSNIITRSHKELDLIDQQAVGAFFEKERPEYVFLAAAKVGGIMGNATYPADFIYRNTMIQANCIHAAYAFGVKKLLFLGSSCIYPKDAPQPIKEDYLLSGPLEPTNKPYAIAKIAGLVMCESYNKQHGTNFISVMPTNLYGPNDNFDLETSHVLPALVRRFHEAKERGDKTVTVWGSGSPKREFLHVDDLADACVYLMETYDKSDIVNIGTGEDITIKELAEAVSDVVGYEGKIEWDTSKPDGTPRKVLDVSRLHGLGWNHSIEFKEGLRNTYEWFLEHKSDIRGV